MPATTPVHRNRSGQSLPEEIANAASHALGFIGAAAAWPVLQAMRPDAPLASVTGLGNPGGFASAGSTGSIGTAVFALTMMLVYLSSTVYHALPDGRAKLALQRLDHAAIFLFIAGSFTPFAWRNLHTPWGLAGFCAVWALAIVGVVCKAGGRLPCPRRSTLLYIALGWIAAVAAWPVWAVLSTLEVTLLAAGGAAYMVGAVFFVFDQRLRYGHFIWHLFVLIGSGCHFGAALSQAMA